MYWIWRVISGGPFRGPLVPSQTRCFRGPPGLSGVPGLRPPRNSTTVRHARTVMSSLSKAVIRTAILLWFGFYLATAKNEHVHFSQRSKGVIANKRALQGSGWDYHDVIVFLVVIQLAFMLIVVKALVYMDDDILQTFSAFCLTCVNCLWWLCCHNKGV